MMSPVLLLEQPIDVQSCFTAAQANIPNPQMGTHSSIPKLAASLAHTSDIPTLTPDEELALQLAHLASQHHTSEYNCLKHGPRGSPVVYVPFSIQFPDQVQQLKGRQAEKSKQQDWWPCKKAINVLSSGNDEPSQAVVKEDMNLIGLPDHDVLPSSDDLQHQLYNALSTSLDTTVPNHVSRQVITSDIKTSDSHPINVSFIIPMELIPMLSSQLVERPHRSPTWFDLSPSYFLDRMTIRPVPAALPASQSSSNLHASTSGNVIPTWSSPPPSSSAHRTAKLSSFLWSSSTIRRAFTSTAGMGSGLYAVNSTKRVRLNGDAPSAQMMMQKERHKTWKSGNGSPPVSGKSVHLTVTAPPIQRSHSAPPAVEDDETLPVASGSMLSSDHAMPPISLPALPALAIPKDVFTLGNMFISSCPGKKVRLTGPIKGRSGVCRDLGQDLRRMKNLGVACIICCLDDEELESLGVSWADYALLAEEIGIDVLRIPIPEGFAPINAAQLDEHLTRLIRTYTLRGLPILVHCRGGVGRAGLIACCWVIKLGLCGWIETEPLVSPLSVSTSIALAGAEGINLDAQTQTQNGTLPFSLTRPVVVRRDTVRLVERVISIVRRRRSPKAIETYEQVKFLVDFVEHLRGKSVPFVDPPPSVPDCPAQND